MKKSLLIRCVPLFLMVCLLIQQSTKASDDDIRASQTLNRFAGVRTQSFSSTTTGNSIEAFNTALNAWINEKTKFGLYMLPFSPSQSGDISNGTLVVIVYYQCTPLNAPK